MLTEKHFWVVAEIWYQRTHRLREYSEDTFNSELKREKALKLFFVMVARMMKVTEMATKIRQPKPPINYMPGGISFGNPVSRNL